MIIDDMTFREIYHDLRSYQDIERLYKKYRNRNEKMTREFFLVLYTQKNIREVTSNFQRVKSRSRILHRRWEKGETLLKLSRELDFSPVMTAFIILTSREWGRSTFRKMINDPESITNKRLSRELREVRDADPIYSPEGNNVQNERGVVGEEKIKIWLDHHNIRYMREEDLREQGGKTPDFLLKKPIYFRGEEINWIESKGSFGDMKEIKKNLKKQLRAYRELFGSGMVIYWFGIIASAPIKEGIVIETSEVLDDHWDFD